MDASDINKAREKIAEIRGELLGIMAIQDASTKRIEELRSKIQNIAKEMGIDLKEDTGNGF